MQLISDKLKLHQDWLALLAVVDFGCTYIFSKGCRYEVPQYETLVVYVEEA